MIYKRAIAKLRAQDWLAITIEFAIVVAGVFVGTLVANWNQEQVQKRETRELLVQIKPELVALAGFSNKARAYYALTRKYAQIAFAGWNDDPRVSDHDFVVAAYQASQIKAMASTSSSWATIVGADQLRNIDDPTVRDPMVRLMTYPDENLGQIRVQSEYRSIVRTIIPDDLQQQIRKDCGDYFATPDALDFSLPERCPLTLDPNEAAATAADLRRHPALVGKLRLHLALVASLLNDVGIYDTAARRLRKALDR